MPLALQRVDSPLGKLAVACSDEGIVALSLPEADLARRMREESADDMAPALVEHPTAMTRRTAAALASYFDGDERMLRDVPLDLYIGSPFQRRVWLALRQHVPRGSITSYGELAHLIGAPGAARAVGAAMARNPVPVVVPCHRVLTADRRLGGYMGAREGRPLDLKRQLLELEGHVAGEGWRE